MNKKEINKNEIKADVKKDIESYHAEKFSDEWVILSGKYVVIKMETGRII
jgi:hypothetical protein